MNGRGKAYEHTPPPLATPGTNRRVALVIGNSEYRPAVGGLRNPKNDSEAIAERLRQPEFGFDVTTLVDLGRDAFVLALNAFSRVSDGCDAIVYFAGHGAAARGQNVLIPVDFAYDPTLSKELLRHEIIARGVSLDLLLAATAKALRVVVFLDACRNDPSRVIDVIASNEMRSLLAGGFRDVDVKSHYLQRLVAYAASYGQKAADGEGKNSPYTKALLALMSNDEPIGSLLNKVRGRVYEDTGQRQLPVEDNSLTADFQLVLSQNKPASEVLTQSYSLNEDQLFEAAALQHWELVKDTADSARLREFLAVYGKSRMGLLAREALQRLAIATLRKAHGASAKTGGSDRFNTLTLTDFSGRDFVLSFCPLSDEVTSAGTLIAMRPMPPLDNRGRVAPENIAMLRGALSAGAMLAQIRELTGARLRFPSPTEWASAFKDLSSPRRTIKQGVAPPLDSYSRDELGLFSPPANTAEWIVDGDADAQKPNGIAIIRASGSSYSARFDRVLLSDTSVSAVLRLIMDTSL